MAVTNYYTVNGEIIAEKTAGSSRVDYLTDALGSVTATVNQSAQVVNTYRYKPYGSQLAKTGVGADPSFPGWETKASGRRRRSLVIYMHFPTILLLLADGLRPRSLTHHRVVSVPCESLSLFRLKPSGIGCGPGCGSAPCRRKSIGTAAALMGIGRRARVRWQIPCAIATEIVTALFPRIRELGADSSIPPIYGPIGPGKPPKCDIPPGVVIGIAVVGIPPVLPRNMRRIRNLLLLFLS